MKRFVIYSEELGIFLGEMLGLGFWSKMDPVGQDAAVTFSNRREALDYISKWMVPEKEREQCEIVPIDTKEHYATIEECVAAGLPSWDPEYQIKD